MPDTHSHIFLNTRPEVAIYKSAQSGGKKPVIPYRNRVSHSQRLIGQFQSLWQNVANRRAEREAISLPSKEGTYIEFKSQVGSDLITKSLEDVRQGVRLLNIRQEGEGKNLQTFATVYVPANKEQHFLKKIKEYQNPEKDTASGKPKNNDLVNSIEDIQIAFLEALWMDTQEMIPTTLPDWCEVWLRIPDSVEGVIMDFLETLSILKIPYKSNYLFFPERSVILIHCNREQLMEIVAQSDFIAEFRIGQEAAGFWVNESNQDQEEWVQDLLSRLNIIESDVRICIMDSGVNNGHRLIQPLLPDENMLTADPNWGVDDHEPGSGHGTLMAGIAAYNKLEEVLASGEPVSLSHKLCSVKILPRPNQDSTPKEFWGSVTDQGISRAEINLPNERIVFCLSITSQTDVDRGRPSSWSGAIDTAAYGSENQKKLIIISAGNINDTSDWNTYPESNLTNSVQNPAQAWNALTVGAITEKVLISDPAYNGHSPLAPIGGLSI